MDVEKIVSNVPTILSVLTNVALVYLLQRRSIAAAEFGIMEKTCTRLREENKSLNQELGQLRERTDLQPILQAIHEWRDEGRGRFVAATAQLEKNTEALTMLVNSHQQLLKEMFPARHKRREDG